MPIEDQTQLLVEAFEWPGDADDAGWITVHVDQVNHVMVNDTNAGHAFYPGTVTRRVYQDGDAIKIETVGAGSGQYARMNEVVGNAVFKKVDNVIYNRIQAEMLGYQIP